MCFEKISIRLSPGVIVPPQETFSFFTGDVIMNRSQAKKVGYLLGKKVAEYKAKRSKDLAKTKKRADETKRKLDKELTEAKALAAEFKKAFNTGLKVKPKVAVKKKPKKTSRKKK